MASIDLPIAASRDRIIEAVQTNQVTLVVGPTGVGKTTQIPQYLLDTELAQRGVIVCTEPRRVAVFAAATRVANERESEVGNEVGYAIRFEAKRSDSTRLMFVTCGVLLREAIEDPMLSKYSCVVVDEAHERDLFTDFLLGYLKRICAQRPDFRVVVMSATLRFREFLQYFPGAKLVYMAARQHPISVVYKPADNRDVVSAAAAVVQEILLTSENGDILVFLPGEREIRSLTDRLQGRKLTGVRVLPLFGSMGPQQQRIVFQRFEGRKVIVATNVAESSVTIDGIAYVVDSGLAKIEGFDIVRNTATLELKEVAQDSATQRSGRAGRTGPGTCIRLYSESNFQKRPKYTEPSISRSDLTGLLLCMRSLGLDREFDFLTQPFDQQWEFAEDRLRSLNALMDDGRLSGHGQLMAVLPVEPTLAHFVLTSFEYECVLEAVTIAAMLTVGRFFVRELYDDEELQFVRRLLSDSESDFFTLLRIWEGYERALSPEKWCHEHHINPYWMQGVKTIREQLLRRLDSMGVEAGSRRTREVLELAILAGFKANALRYHRQSDYQDIHGRPARISRESVLDGRNPQYVVCYGYRGNHRVYATCVHQLRYSAVAEVAPELLDPRARTVKSGHRPIALKGVLKVERNGKSRTVNVNVDLGRSTSLEVQSLDRKRVVIEEERFPLRLLGLSPGTEEALQRVGVVSLAQLPNYGRELNGLGLNNEQVTEVMQRLVRLSYIRRHIPETEKRLAPKHADPAHQEPVSTKDLTATLLDRPIQDLKCTGKTLMKLVSAGIRTIGQLAEMTEHDLGGAIQEGQNVPKASRGAKRYIGVDAVHEVKTRLAYYGLKLKEPLGGDKWHNKAKDASTVQLAPATPLDEERAIDLLGLWYPYFKGVREGDEDDRVFCRNVIAEANLGLPGHFCRNLYWYWHMVQDPMLAYEDLFQEGCIGLLWAIEKYDYTRGFRLSTYAQWWITQNILRAVDNATLLPVHVIDRLRSWRGKYYKLAKKLGSEPTREEFALFVGKPDKEVERFYAQLQLWRHFVSLDEPLKGKDGEDGDKTRLDNVEQGYEPDLDESLDQSKLRDAVQQILNDSALLDAEKQCVTLHFGLNGNRVHTLEEIGGFMGVTRERIRQRIEKALSKLRNEDVWKEATAYIPSLPKPSQRFEREFSVEGEGYVAVRTASTLQAEPTKRLVTVDDILDAVAKHYHITRVDLMASARRNELTIPRLLTMYLLHWQIKLQYREIGELFGVSRQRVHQIVSTVGPMQAEAQTIVNEMLGIEQQAALPAESQVDGQPSVDQVLSVVSDYYGVTRSEMFGASRKRNFVVPRHIAMFILHDDLEMSLTEVANLFGDRDHTTVLDAHAKVKAEIQKIPQSRAIIDHLRGRLGIVKKEVKE